MGRKKKERVFVYGTLLKGMFNHGRMNGARYCGKGRTMEKYYMTAGTVPYVNSDPQIAEDKIKGELYEVGPGQLRHIDIMEGHPTFYERRLCAVEMEYGWTEIVWMYFNDNHFGENYIEDGDYRAYAEPHLEHLMHYREHVQRRAINPA